MGDAMWCCDDRCCAGSPGRQYVTASNSRLPSPSASVRARARAPPPPPPPPPPPAPAPTTQQVSHTPPTCVSPQLVQRTNEHTLGCENLFECDGTAHKQPHQFTTMSRPGLGAPVSLRSW